jgi:Tol biopolymer transport system component
VRRWYGIAAVAAFTVFSVVLLDWRDRPEPPLPKITRTLQLTSDGLEKFPEIVTDGVRVYFPELRSGHWTVCAVPISGGEATAIPLPFPNVVLLNISPDKSELLIGEGSPINDYPLWRVPILGGTPRRMGSIVAHSAAWSPDGRKLMFMHEGDAYIANGDGSAPRKIDLPQAEPNTWAWYPRWSPDGSRISFGRYIMDKHISSMWEVSALGDNPHQLLPNWQKPPMQCCEEWSPDGSLSVFDVWNHLEGGAPLAPAPDIWVIRKQSDFLHKTSAEPTQLTAGPIHFFAHAFSTDGKSLFAVSTQRREELSQFDSKTKKFSPYPGLGPAHSISFSRDGWVAYTKFPQGELWRKKGDGSELLQLTFQPLMAYGPQWSPDGQQIVFWGQEPGQGYGLYLVSAEGGQVRKIFQESRTRRFDPSWSADGSSILFWSSSEAGQTEIDMFNLQTQQLSKVPGSEAMALPRWSPDGKYISALSAQGLMLFDVKEKKWSTLLTHVQNQTWSNDAEAIYFIRSQPQPGVFRLSITDRKVREVASLSGVRISDTVGQPLFLTPKNEPLVRQQTEMETEIYALFWTSIKVCGSVSGILHKPEFDFFSADLRDHSIICKSANHFSGQTLRLPGAETVRGSELSRSWPNGCGCSRWDGRRRSILRACRDASCGTRRGGWRPAQIRRAGGRR